MSVNDIFNVLNDDTSVVAILVFIIVAGVRKWWTFGWVYREKVKECEEWKQLALTGTRIAERVASSVPQRRRRADSRVDPADDVG